MKKTMLLALSILAFSFTFLEDGEFPKSLKKKISKKFVFVPSGEAMLKKNKVNVDEFYISSTEVSNLDYLEFLRDLQLNDPQKYQMALPDTTVWSQSGSKNTDYVNNYLRNPGFRLFPVVGVSWSQANMYCEWVNEVINERLEHETKVKVRLPTEAEWIRAARGDKHTSMYTWGSPYARNRKGKPLANYKRTLSKDQVPESNIITCEVFRFIQNDFGVFNMCGNVAELTQDPKIIKGGSWFNDESEMQIDAVNITELPSNHVGFRIIIAMAKN